MISQRQADILKKVKSHNMRAIHFFADRRENVLSFDATTRTLKSKTNGAESNYDEMFGNLWRMVDADGVIVLINKEAAEKSKGKRVIENGELVGDCLDVTIDGLLRVRNLVGIEIFFSPLEYLIHPSINSTIIIQRAPL